MRYLVVAKVADGLGNRLALEFVDGAVTAAAAAAQYLARTKKRGTLVQQYAVLSGGPMTIEMFPTELQDAVLRDLEHQP